MMCLRKSITAAVAVLLLAAVASAQEPIRFARTPDISPDGKLVAFSYLGDIWVVETIGGIARPVTMHEAHEVYPLFSPDGRMLAFTSNRHGSYDVFVVPVQGGKPRRLTFDSSADVPTGWSPDGKTLLFASTRSTAFPFNYELYTVPVETGQVRRITMDGGREGVYAPRGDQIAYVRGPGTWYRKGYRGSSNDDVWLCNADGTNNRRFTDFNGQDTSPMWSADGQTLYYVSECFGNPANIVCREVAGKGKPRQITFHKDEAVRRARISGNGEWIVYECGPDIWVVPTRGGKPRKLAIEVHADDKSNTERTVTYRQGASEFALSADEQHVAFSVHGSLFMMPISGGKATRLTDSPRLDHGIAWSPDNKKIIFASDRSGHEELYLLEPDDPEHPELVKAHKFKVRKIPITDRLEEKTGIGFSPDGKLVSFLCAGKLWTMNPDGTDQKVVIKDTQVIDYEWSPDSHWLAFARLDGSWASEIYIMPAKGGPARNVTHYATWNAGITWGNDKLAFVSQRRGRQSMYVLSFQKPAVAGAPPSKEIDWEDIHLRVKAAAEIHADDGAISPDGTKVAFRSGNELWLADSNGTQLNRLTSSNASPQQIQWSKRTPGRVYFRDGAGRLRWSQGAGEPAVVAFSARMTIRRDEEFAEMLEQSWRALADHFYDPKLHGADWNAVHEKYQPLVKHVAMKEDLYALISLMMGELNASHLGIYGFGATPEETTADLGLLFDESYRGPGLKVAEILKRGPADKRGISLKPGDIILAIDREPITERTNISKLLNDKRGDPVLLEVTSSLAADPKDPKARRRVEIQAVGRQEVSNLMYERWVEHNTKRVLELSKGKLGYIHIPSMDQEGLDRFVRALYSENFDKDAIVLDVRYNGGGFTHDQVLNYLGAKEHTFFRSRYGEQGLVLRSYDRKWTRPLVLLVNNRSYSDAEIFPSAFRTLGLGKLVGQPTGGFVIGTSQIRLIDGSMFRVPGTGVYTVKGINMEKEGVVPDVVVEPHPDDLAKGKDAQLEKAVEVLLQDVIAWKKARSGGVALKPDPAKTGPVVAPVPAPAPMGK